MNGFPSGSTICVEIFDLRNETEERVEMERYNPKSLREHDKDYR